MSEQWYCPQCGPTTTYQYWCGESDTLFIHCTVCQGLDVSKEMPMFVLAMQERIKALEAALIQLRDCDWTITLPDRMDAVRDIARKALQAAGYGGEGVRYEYTQ